MRFLLLPPLFILCLQVLAAQPATDTAFVVHIEAHRQHYKQEFLTSPRSPLTAQDTGLLDFFAPDPAWRIAAHLSLTPDSLPFDLLTYSGATRLYRQYGILHFNLGGQPHSLRIYQNLTLIARDPAYRDHLFLPFKDQSNGSVTYGGGRYLDFRTGDVQQGVLVLDFNKAYNPYCAYSDGYNCPIPPKPNHLALQVQAGEKNFRGEKKH